MEYRNRQALPPLLFGTEVSGSGLFWNWQALPPLQFGAKDSGSGRALAKQEVL